MKIDDVIKAVEKEFITDTIKNSRLSQDETILLMEKLNSSPQDRFEIDFSSIKNNIDLVTDLITDLVLLAKRDNEFHPKEKSYIEFVADILDVKKEDLDRIMN